MVCGKVLEEVISPRRRSLCRDAHGWKPMRGTACGGTYGGKSMREPCKEELNRESPRREVIKVMRDNDGEPIRREKLLLLLC